MDWDAVNLPDPQTQVGTKGWPKRRSSAAAVRCALAGALGDEYLRRTPVGIDMILASIEAKKRLTGFGSNV
jgi:hypothetical protein